MGVEGVKREKEKVFLVPGSQHRVAGIETPWLFLSGNLPCLKTRSHLLPYSQGLPVAPSMLGTKFNASLWVLPVPSCRGHQVPRAKGQGTKCGFSQSVHLCEPCVFMSNKGSLQLHKAGASWDPQVGIPRAN